MCCSGSSSNSLILVFITSVLIPAPSTAFKSYYPSSKYVRVHQPAGYSLPKQAVVELETGSDPLVSGTLTVTATAFPRSAVVIAGKVYGLTPGKHGFHIHMNGTLTNKCKDTGGHFNPDGVDHMGPTDEVRHAGDLGNIVTPDLGPTTIYIYDSKVSLGDGGVYDIAGRGIVIHAGEDDLGRGGDDGSRKTGNAGGRVACGTITPIN